MASNFGATADASEAAAPDTAFSKYCGFYGLGNAPKISPFPHLPDAALLLFIASFFLAAVARSNLVACLSPPHPSYFPLALLSLSPSRVVFLPTD